MRSCIGKHEPIIGIFNARGVVGADLMVSWGQCYRSWDLEGRYKKAWGCQWRARKIAT